MTPESKRELNARLTGIAETALLFCSEHRALLDPMEERPTAVKLTSLRFVLRRLTEQCDATRAMIDEAQGWTA